MIASGGAGALDHFVDVFTRGRADAALAASIFHYAETSVRALKQHLRAARHSGATVRLESRPTMLIPSIDLKGGAVVQLVQGERLAIRDDDVFRWVRRFERFPKVQVIDLDAAMGSGDNLALVRQIAGALSCRVGGGIRTVDARAGDARRRRAAGHRRLVALQGRPARPRRSPKRSRDAVGGERVIAAVDSRGGQVVIHGWKTTLPLTAVEAVRALEPYCDEFLYTHVDTEGLMGGTEPRGDPRRPRRHDPPR